MIEIVAENFLNAGEASLPADERRPQTPEFVAVASSDLKFETLIAATNNEPIVAINDPSPKAIPRWAHQFKGHTVQPPLFSWYPL